MKFKPYFNTHLNIRIDTQEQQEWVDRIAGYNFNQLAMLNDDLRTDQLIDPSLRSSKLQNIKARAIARGIQRCRRKGDFGQEPITLFGVIASIMEGMIIGDEWSKRF
jgi:hypothetical protein